VRPGSARENQRLQEASGRVWAVLRLIPWNRNLGGRRMRRHAPRCAPPTRFSHGLGPNRQFAAAQHVAAIGGTPDGRSTRPIAPL
jgi:hypothetical protein